MSQQGRARQMSERIHTLVAELLARRVKDPRLGFVTVTDVRVTPDCRDATVFYTVLGDDADRAASAAALESAKGVLRSEVGHALGVRHTPTLAFVADVVPDTARHIEALLDVAAAHDAAVLAASAGASYAGEADPYRVPRDADEDDADPAPGGPVVA